MNVDSPMCASSDRPSHWDQIDWDQCRRHVRRLQARIVKATREGRWGKVKTLQWLLTHSSEAGRKHPGLRSGCAEPIKLLWTRDIVGHDVVRAADDGRG